MMTRKRADALARVIDNSHHVIVEGRRVWGDDQEELQVRDQLTGYSCVIGSEEEWAERVRESQLYA